MNDMQSLNLRERFLSAMGKVASVNVVTTDGPAGRSGVTVSEMSSVSADGENPTILVSICRASRCWHRQIFWCPLGS